MGKRVMSAVALTLAFLMSLSVFMTPVFVYAKDTKGGGKKTVEKNKEKETAEEDTNEALNELLDLGSDFVEDVKKDLKKTDGYSRIRRSINRIIENESFKKTKKQVKDSLTFAFDWMEENGLYKKGLKDDEKTEYVFNALFEQIKTKGKEGLKILRSVIRQAVVNGWSFNEKEVHDSSVIVSVPFYALNLDTDFPVEGAEEQKEYIEDSDNFIKIKNEKAKKGDIVFYENDLEELKVGFFSKIEETNKVTYLYVIDFEEDFTKVIERRLMIENPSLEVYRFIE